MNVIVLAAGYGTRLGDLERDCPKGLLQLGEMCLLDRLLMGLTEIPGPIGLYLVTNRRFLPAFREWAQNNTGQRAATAGRIRADLRDTAHQPANVVEASQRIDEGRFQRHVHISLRGD